MVMQPKNRVWGKILRDYRTAHHPKLRAEDLAAALGHKPDRQVIYQKESGKHPIFEEELYVWLEKLNLDYLMFCIMVRDELKSPRKP